MTAGYYKRKWFVSITVSEKKFAGESTSPEVGKR
jgi:hypothetical protein